MEIIYTSTSFNLARTWHLQLAIFWVATSYLAAGIFLAPIITGREPRGQNYLSYLLLGALASIDAIRGGPRPADYLFDCESARPGATGLNLGH